MIIASTPLMPDGWKIESVEAIVPLALSVASHLLYPGRSIFRRNKQVEYGLLTCLRIEFQLL